MNSMKDAMMSVFLVIGILALAGLLMFPLSPVVLSQVDNYSIESRVNVTNAAPVVRQVRLYSESAGPGSAITLTEGTTTHILCNGTFLDANGYQDINTTHGTNSTMWQGSLSSFSAIDDNNDHYSNTTCTVVQVNSSFGYTQCSFQVAYYANNDTSWLCNISVSDLDGLVSFNYSENTTLSPLFAINVSVNETGSNILDFGNMAPDTTTADGDEKLLNITNTGNINISFAIDGWGETFNDNLSMNCTIGDIADTDLRYDVNDNTAYASMYNLTAWAPPLYLPGINGTLAQRVDDGDTDQSESTNTTWWKLHVPLGTKGFCNGTVIISAVDVGAP